MSVKYKIKKLNVDGLQLSDWNKVKLSIIQDCSLKNQYQIKGYYPRDNKFVVEKENVLLVINISSNVIVSTMDHPTRGITKLKRKNLSLREMELVIENPTIHTNKGEYIVSNKSFNNPKED